MKCLIAVEGGVGKNVMLTSIMSQLKKKYNEIYVITPYVDAFKCCPEVTDCFPMGPQSASLYHELVLSDDCDVLWREPYSNQHFIKKQTHLFNAWLEEYGFEKGPEGPSNLVPSIDVESGFPEIAEDAKKEAEALGKFIMVQFCGGQSPLAPNEKYDWHQEAIKRNYFKAQELVDKLKAAYPDTTIIHYALPTEPQLRNTKLYQKPFIWYAEMAKYAMKVVCTDSSLQHLSTGKCKDVTVIWGETRPEHFGYSINKNICAKNVYNGQPYFKPMGASPALVTFPTPDEVMEVVASSDVKVEIKK